MKKLINRLIKIIHPESIEDGIGKLTEDLRLDTKNIYYELGKSQPNWKWIQDIISNNDNRIKEKPLIKVTLEYDEWQINKQTINESYQIGQDIRKIKTELYNLRSSKEISDLERIQKLISKNDALIQHNTQIQDSLVFDDWLICRYEFLKAYRFPSDRLISHIIKFYSRDMNNDFNYFINSMSEFMTYVFIKTNPEFVLIDLYKFKKFFIEYEKYFGNFNDYKDVKQFLASDPYRDLKIYFDRTYNFIPISLIRVINNDEELANLVEDWFNTFLIIIKDAFDICKDPIRVNPEYEYNRMLNEFYQSKVLH